MTYPNLIAPIVLASLVVAFSTKVHAAPVTFTVLGAVASASDVKTNGSLIQAEYAGGSGPQTVNGVVFHDGFTDYILPSGETKGAYLSDTGSESYNAILTAFAYDSHGKPGPTVLTLKGLTAGKKYEVQLWSLDNRSGQNAREVNFSDANGNASPTFAEGSNTIILGTFTADATTQAVEVNGITEEYAKNLNAFQVRQVP